MPMLILWVALAVFAWLLPKTLTSTLILCLIYLVGSTGIQAEERERAQRR